MKATQFLSAYKDGAFIAFHGFWNRAPSPQGGYNVVFQPLAGGKASGPFVVVADGFAGAVKAPGTVTSNREQRGNVPLSVETCLMAIAR
jgi:glucose/arabinose dehydrogenase